MAEKVIGNQYAKESTAISYVLQPGDATRYEFTIVWLPDINLFPTEVLVAVHMGGGRFNGSVIASIYDLREADRFYLSYLHGKMPNMDRYTAFAILLAAGVLVDDPNNLTGACEAMLTAPERMRQ